MNKKSIISLALIGCMITSTAQPFFWNNKPQPWYKAWEKSFKRSFRKTGKFLWKQKKAFSKEAPGVPAIVIGMLITAMASALAKKIIFTATLPYEVAKEKAKSQKGILEIAKEKAKKEFLDNKDEDQLKEQNIEAESADVSFSNPEHFAPNSIDPGIQKLRNKIRAKRQHPDNRVVQTRVKIPRFILLHGRSQVGKSHSAKALARELGAKEYISCAGAQIEDKYVGESQKILRNTFNKAENISSKDIPGVLIIDEIDGVINKQTKDSSTGVTRKISQTFQHIRDAVMKKNKNIYVIATTNYLEDLQPEIRNRFKADGGTIEMQAPNEEARRGFLRNRTNAERIDVTEEWMENTVNETEGYDYVQLENIITEINDRFVNDLPAMQDNNLDLERDIDEVVPENNSGIINKAKNRLIKPVVRPIASFASKTKTFLHALITLKWLYRQEEAQEIPRIRVEENADQKERIARNIQLSQNKIKELANKLEQAKQKISKQKKEMKKTEKEELKELFNKIKDKALAPHNTEIQSKDLLSSPNVKKDRKAPVIDIEELKKFKTKNLVAKKKKITKNIFDDFNFGLKKKQKHRLSY